MPSSEYPRYRIICIEVFSSNLPVQVMETGSIQQVLGCSPNRLNQIYAYVFHPLDLIGKVLREVQQDRASIILITPAWQA